MWKLALCVFLGSGIGGVCRYLASRYIEKFIGSIFVVGAVKVFPWPTLMVNILGCFLIGLIYGIVDANTFHLSEQAKAFLTAGFCGGLTTFSTFSNENYLLFQSSEFSILLIYVAVSILLGFLAAYGGHALMRAV